MPSNSDDEAGEENDRPPKIEGPPDEKILAPEDLDFTEDEKVEQLDEGKFVIGTEGEPRVPPEERMRRKGGAIPDRTPPEETAADSTTDPVSEPTPESTTEPAEPSGEDDSSQQSTEPTKSPTQPEPTTPDELTGRAVKEFISSELRRTDSLYAYRIAAKTDDVVSHQQLASDDIGMAFDGLLMWYAQQVSSDTAVEDALGILLAKSNIRIKYPTKLLAAYLRTHDLSPDDDIADLLKSVRAEGGLVFPPGSQP